MLHAILNVFEQYTLLNKHAPDRNFYTVAVASIWIVLFFVNRVRKLSLVLKVMGFPIDDGALIMGVLDGLPKRFENLIVALDTLCNDKKHLRIYWSKDAFLERAMARNESRLYLQR